MKKFLVKILITVIILVGVLGPFGLIDNVSAAPEETYNVDTLDCHVFSFNGVLGCVTVGAYHIIYTPSSLVLSLSASIFNSLLSFSISREVMNADFVKTAWDALRGMANLLFILVLVVVSISIILDFGKFNSKEIIRDVIIIALFVNFSLFAARVVIDAGNITALGFYDAIQSKSVESDDININTAVIGIQEKDVAGNIVSSFNPARLLSPQSFRIWKNKHENENNNWGSYTSLIFIFLLASFISLYTAYFFFMAGFIFVVRVAYLWVYMATAPLAFIAYIMPDLKPYWEKWWKELIDKSFCITMFLFWIWLILMIIQSDYLKTAFFSSEGVDFKMTRFIAMIFLQYMIIITLLRKSLEYTKKMCDDGGLGEKVFGLAKTAASFAIPSVAGAKTAGAALQAAGGIGLRQTIGAGAGAIVGQMEKRGVGTGRMGRTLLQSTRAIEKAKFGTEESYKERVEGKAKKQEAYMKTLPKEIKTKTGQVRKPQEEFVKEVGEDWTTGSIISKVTGQRGGEKKFIDDYKKKKEINTKVKKLQEDLKPIQRDLDKAKDNLKLIKESGSTPEQIDNERDKVFDAQQKFDKIKSDIKNEKDKLKS